MKLKYYFPTSLEHLKKDIVVCALFMGLVIAIMTSVAHATDLTINATTATLYGDLTYGNVSITNGSTVTIAAYNGTAGTGYLNLSGLTSFTLDATSTINGQGKGYSSSGSGSGSAQTGGFGYCAYYGGRSGYGGWGAGSYGTVGGVGGDGGACEIENTAGGTGGNPGSTYGTTSGFDISMGSGNTVAGGGMLRVSAKNITSLGTLLFNGTEGMDGANAPYNFWGSDGGNGGGSGGGVEFIGYNVNTTGQILHLVGGAGGDHGAVTYYNPGHEGTAGATGGSGRYKVHYGDNGNFTNTSSYTASGTVYYSNDSYWITTPVITSPTESELIAVLNVNITYNASSDEDNPALPLTYHVQISDSSTFATIENETYTTNLYYNVTITSGLKYSRVKANNTARTSDWSSTRSFFLGGSTLYTPANNTEFSILFPVLTYETAFLWSLPSGYGSNLQIATDSDFNTIVYDEVLSVNTHTASLPASNYKWRVRFYDIDSATYYAWGEPFNFSIVSTPPTLTGTAVYGVVHELISGIQVPVSGAEVRIWDNYSTYSAYATTGGNGYFSFSGLTNNTTYFIQAKKTPLYNDGAVEIITTGSGTQTEKNLLLTKYISPYVPNFVYEKFVVRSLFDRPYSGITVTIYDYPSVVAMETKTTDSLGQAVFQLIKDHYYRVTFSGGGMSSTLTDYIYGKEDVYLITITDGFPTGGDKDGDINASLFVTTINATHSQLSLYYNDNSSTTTIINFYAKNYTSGVASCTPQSSTSQSVTISCIVLSTGTYQWGYNATSTKYGFMRADDVVNFAAYDHDAPQLIGTKMTADVLNWISILGLIFIAGLFSVKNVRFGVVLVPLTATFLYWGGALDVSAVLVHSTLVLGFLVYLRMSESKVSQ